MTPPQSLDRRTFIKAAAAGAGVLASASAAAASGDKKLVIGLIGCGLRGAQAPQSLASFVQQCDNVELAWVCDPVQTKRDAAAARYGVDPSRSVADMRQVLSDDQVDAVVIATPDHWHCPAAMLACEAGKHVYLEKPMSQNLREGRMLVDAAARSNAMIHVGTQSRSTPMFVEAMKLLHDGAIGEVLAARCWNVQKRPPLGHAQPTDPPSDLDYDTWIGPAPMIPYQSNRVLENKWWSHWRMFGTGDMGNDGVHELDQVRWGMRLDTHPARVTALGVNSYFDDDCEFADTQQVVFEFPRDAAGHVPTVIYEQRMWSTNYPFNVDGGVEFYGTAGQLFISRRGKLQLRGRDNKIVETPIHTEQIHARTVEHLTVLFDAIRTGDGSQLTSPLVGHMSASLVHLGNLAARLNRTLTFDPTEERIVGDDEANALLGRTYRDHWSTPKVGATG